MANHQRLTKQELVELDLATKNDVAEAKEELLRGLSELKAEIFKWNLAVLGAVTGMLGIAALWMMK